MALKFDDTSNKNISMIPVEFDGENYIFKVNKAVWNQVQIMLLEGAEKRNIILEFNIDRKF